MPAPRDCDSIVVRVLTTVMGSLLLGSFVLLLFGLSIPVVQVAGGAVVCALGWKLLADIPKPADVTLDPIHAKLIALGRAFAPLTLPITIDAGVISVAITVGANHAHTFKHAVIQLLVAVIGAGIIALSILLTYRYAQRVGKWIGHTGMMVVVRLSAFIMLCIGVGITWNGVKALLAEIGIHCVDWADEPCLSNVQLVVEPVRLRHCVRFPNKRRATGRIFPAKIRPPCHLMMSG